MFRLKEENEQKKRIHFFTSFLCCALFRFDEKYHQRMNTEWYRCSRIQYIYIYVYIKGQQGESVIMSMTLASIINEADAGRCADVSPLAHANQK